MSDENRLEKSLLANVEKLPVRAAETVKTWGKTLIVAPHPDDESLGCGGAIALLRKFGCAVFAVVVSDGTLSHPNSKKFFAENLRDLREREMLDALAHLGVGADCAAFLRYKDRSVPNENSTEFVTAVDSFAELLRRIEPQTVLLPWRRDPHPDHLASSQIAHAAGAKIDFQIKFIEYPIWLWELAARDDAPQIGEVAAFRLDISEVVQQKQLAINAHRSQTTDLIDDDPAAFRLTPEILRHFAGDTEIYLESFDE